MRTSSSLHSSASALRRIPQEVSAVATDQEKRLRLPTKGIVSIPQAVSAVATVVNSLLSNQKYRHVSIPQAVSAVATVSKLAGVTWGA